MDISGDGSWEQVRAGISEAETVAKLGGRDVFMHGVEQVNTGALGGGEGEGSELRQIEEVGAKWG